ncbi:hypothetical protein C8J57DRAFT_1247393 [Mycena rebaudengoi]|nr:hypothetical protein C8J57DRAFT_1247393 [Mycena rebaudengoi]
MTGFLSNWQSFLGRMRHVLLTIALAGLATFNREQLLMELLVVMGKFGSTLRRLDRTGLGGLDVTPADIVRDSLSSALVDHVWRRLVAGLRQATTGSVTIWPPPPPPSNFRPTLRLLNLNLSNRHFIAMGDLAQANPRAERDGYISAPVEQVKDVVHWWGSSTPAERAFSSSSLTGTKLRNRLTPEIFEALQLLKSAYRNGHISATADAGKHMDALIAELDSQNFGFADLEIDSDGDEFIM